LGCFKEFLNLVSMLINTEDIIVRLDDLFLGSIKSTGSRKWSLICMFFVYMHVFVHLLCSWNTKFWLLKYVIIKEFFSLTKTFPTMPWLVVMSF
jgi:hypothetical protein